MQTVNLMEIEQHKQEILKQDILIVESYKKYQKEMPIVKNKRKKEFQTLLFMCLYFITVMPAFACGIGAIGYEIKKTIAEEKMNKIEQNLYLKIGTLIGLSLGVYSIIWFICTALFENKVNAIKVIQKNNRLKKLIEKHSVEQNVLEENMIITTQNPIVLPKKQIKTETIEHINSFSKHLIQIDNEFSENKYSENEFSENEIYFTL